MNSKKAPDKESATVPCSFRLPIGAIHFLEKLPGENLTDKLLGFISHGRAVGYFGAEIGKTNMLEALLTRVEQLERSVYRNM